MAAALWLFCGATIDTVGEWRPPPQEPRATDDNTLRSSQFASTSAAFDVEQTSTPGVRITVEKPPDLTAMLHAGVWMFELFLIGCGVLLVGVLVFSYISTHERWRRTPIVRLPLNRALQAQYRNGSLGPSSAAEKKAQ